MHLIRAGICVLLLIGLVPLPVTVGEQLSLITILEEAWYLSIISSAVTGHRMFGLLGVHPPGD